MFSRTAARCCAALRPRRLQRAQLGHTYARLEPYEPPAWASALRPHAPRVRVKLAQTPTPLHLWPAFSEFSASTVFIKRDDLTHGSAAGNKIRKLEFLLADALQQGARAVVTCGGVQSNHCRSTAILCRELGLEPHLVLRSGTLDPQQVARTGNLLLDQLVGSGITLVPRSTPFEPGLRTAMETVAKHNLQRNMPTYLIPVGGSNTVGLWGYLEGFAELHEQCMAQGITTLVTAVGSGGTACGLALGNHLMGSPFRVLAVSVCDDATYFYDHVDETLQALGLGPTVQARELLTVVDGFKGPGYAQFTPDDLHFIQQIARRTGVLLDTTYTGKAARGLAALLQQQDLGRVCFLHTGGIYGLLDGRHAS